jgi:hypothetical protein
MTKKLSFGTEPTMREVPPGQFAIIKFGKFSDWKIVETEKYGEKYDFPITLLEHPSYESIPKAGIQMRWQSKAYAGEAMYNYIYDAADVMKTFDWDVNKEFEGTWKLHRFETGGYQLEQK